MAISAEIKINAVKPFIEAYIGGRKDNGSTLGSLTVNSKATTTGIKTDTKIISLLYLIGSAMVFTLIALKYLL
jgi:hypothetical protein|tara:strand:+ start:238 stop:456 length:219 start_codon:yes stop_codon:yes gene_type:complete